MPEQAHADRGNEAAETTHHDQVSVLNGLHYQYPESERAPFVESLIDMGYTEDEAAQASHTPDT